MASTNPSLQNGNSMPSHAALQYAEFYENLFSLQKEVYAGKHSRINLPQSVIAQTFSKAVQDVPSNSATVANGPSKVSTHISNSPASQDPSSILFPPFSAAKSSVPAPTASPKYPPSVLDPIFLTKSDGLLRAETQLRRQRIERSLKDLYDAKKGLPRDKDFLYDSEMLFDVDDILARALAAVEPVSGFPDADSSDSVDEDSYYSSKANSWSTDEQVASGWKDDQIVISNASKGKSNMPQIDHQGGIPNVQPEDVDPDDDDEYEPTADLEMIEPEYEPELSGFHHSEDDDYSPPPADLNPVRAPNGHIQGVLPPPSTRNRRRHEGLPEPVPVFRNQIKSPVAPQPSRISPLATAKQARPIRNRNNQNLQQNKSRPGSPTGHDNGSTNRQNKHGNNNFKSPRNGGRQSPSIPKNGIQIPRKRRREVDQAEKQAERQRRNAEKRVARSPELEIKDEPVSPPPFPFSDPQPLRRRMHEYPGDAEAIQPRARTRPLYRITEPKLAQRVYEHDEPTTPTQDIARIPHPGHRRIVERDDQNLRRVASLQYARRQSPIPESRPLRAVSRAYLEPAPLPVYRAGSMRPPPQYTRDRSRSPVYVDDGHPGIMGPPPAPAPRPFIVDEYGNKYYAAPPERPRVVERSSTREPMLRASIRPVDPYDDEEAVRMPPPSRRYVEHPEPERQYRGREFSTARDEFSRHSTIVYGDMPAPAQSYVSRSYSLRPEADPREPGVEYVTRHQSIAPGRDFPGRGSSVARAYREVSVMREAKHQEEGVRYTYRAPVAQRRVIDEGEEELYGESSRRVSYGY